MRKSVCVPSDSKQERLAHLTALLNITSSLIIEINLLQEKVAPDL